MKRAVIYTRVSEKQQERGKSREEQERECREKCAELGLEVVAVCHDTYSGADTMDERDGLWKARDLVRDGEATEIVCWRIDRQNRDTTDNLILLKELTRVGGHLISVKDGVFGDRPEDDILLAALSYAAKIEHAAITTRTHTMLRARVRDGALLNGAGPLFGYAFADETRKAYVVDPTSGEVVRRMFTWYVEGMGVWQITRQLEELHEPTPSQYATSLKPSARKVATHWSKQQVYTILTDRSYTGKHAVFQHAVTKVKQVGVRGRAKLQRRVRSDDDAHVVFLTIPPLVDAAVFEQVQQSLAERKQSRTKDGEQTLLSRGIARCGVCGGKMVQLRHPKYHYHVYQCEHRSGQYIDRSKTCPAGAFAVRAMPCDTDVWQKVWHVAKDSETTQRVLQQRAGRVERASEDLTRLRNNLETQLQDTDTRRQNLLDGMERATSQDVRLALDERLQGVLDTRKDLTKKLVALEKAQQVWDYALSLYQATAQLVQEKPAGYEYSRAEKRQILESLGVSVLLYPVKHEFSQTHEVRWDIIFDPSLSILDNGNFNNFPLVGIRFSYSEWVAA